MQDNPMDGLIDKLCDHLTVQRIKILIQSGFDDWQTITFMKGKQLVEMKYNAQQCIVIMIAINAHSKQLGGKQIFEESQMQQVLALAKQNQKEFQAKVMQQQAQKKLLQMKIQQQNRQIVQDIKQYQQKIINEAILLKGVTLKGKEKVSLNKITLISLQQKEITIISNMQLVPLVQNLHLGHNHIYHIQNLQKLTKLKILKLESNEIVKMQGFTSLIALQQLLLNDNHISIFEGLTNNRCLHFININNQRTKKSLQYQEETCMALSYCLETLYSDGNRCCNVSNLRHLKVLNILHLKNNNIGDMAQLPLSHMQSLKSVEFKGNPICSVPKYRDYMVILSKKLQQLDNKKILPAQREYLVKLYSLKHAKQVKQQGQIGSKKAIKDKEIQGIHVTKLQQGLGPGQYAHNSDLRGNVTYANTKLNKKK